MLYFFFTVMHLHFVSMQTLHIPERRHMSVYIINICMVIIVFVIFAKPLSFNFFK